VVEKVDQQTARCPSQVLSGVALTAEGAPHGACLNAYLSVASLPATLPVHVRDIRSRVCHCGLRSSVCMSFEFGQHSPPHTLSKSSSLVVWFYMKRTCATCHEYSWHAPLFRPIPWSW